MINVIETYSETKEALELSDCSSITGIGLQVGDSEGNYRWVYYTPTLISRARYDGGKYRSTSFVDRLCQATADGSTAEVAELDEFIILIGNLLDSIENSALAASSLMSPQVSSKS